MLFVGCSQWSCDGRLGTQTFLETKVEFLRTTRSCLDVYPVVEEGTQEGGKSVNEGLLV
jgi:hypothetical protein